MRIYNGHGFEIGIFNPRDDRARWYQGSAEVPHSPVIPRVENADLKSMPLIDSFSCTPTPFTINLGVFLQFIQGSILFQTASQPASLVTMNTRPLCKQISRDTK